MHQQTDPAVFIQNFESGQTQLAHQWLPGDLETPVSAYLKLCGGQNYSFLLESVEGGENLARYSIIGHNPDLVWTYDHGTITTNTNGKTNTVKTDDPLKSFRATIKSCAIDSIPPNLPPMAVSGLFGYMGYDTIRLIEDIPNANPDTLGIPEGVFIRPKILAIFDNVKNMICLIRPVYDHKDNSQQTAQQALESANADLNAQLEALKHPINPELLGTKSNLTAPITPISNTPKDQFLSMVQKTVDYIHEGEIFQGVISQRFTADFDLPPFALYRSLRSLNPSPFLFYVQMDDYALVGSSPEILVRVRDNTLTIRPIAGTRHRGATPEEDQALADELLADEKERAEHLMLLDLGRNDVGKVSKYGTVKITAQYIIERYSHVMHIVSNVEGQLDTEKYDALDAFFSGFPAGTVSGAPKIRAMEIIDELEQERRSFYAGSVGYFSPTGDIDTCIALRTALVKDGKLHVQAGGGIVADSEPEFEYVESVNKAKAIVAAAENAIKAAQ